MVIRKSRVQASTELLLLIGLAVLVAAIVGLYLKSLAGTVGNEVIHGLDGTDGSSANACIGFDEANGANGICSYSLGNLDGLDGTDAVDIQIAINWVLALPVGNPSADIDCADMDHDGAVCGDTADVLGIIGVGTGAFVDVSTAPVCTNPVRGDIDGDGAVNAVDVQRQINMLRTGTNLSQCGDVVGNDLRISIDDVQEVINIALGS